MQSHYIPCQIQLVTEFAVQEREGDVRWRAVKYGYKMDKLMGKIVGSLSGGLFKIILHYIAQRKLLKMVSFIFWHEQ